MGRYIKNKELKSGSYSIRAPHTPASVGPNAPVDGLIRYNYSIHKMQYYSLGAWRNFGYEGLVDIVKDTFVGDGETRTFGPMLKSYDPGREVYLFVTIGNVFQNPGVAYTVLNNQITFVSPPNLGQPIIILHGYGTTVIS